MSTRYEELDVFITVKAYPNPSKSVQESCCIAGLTREGQWVRLFPLNFRALPSTTKFRKYDWIRVRVMKSRDRRPETFYPDADSIEVLEHVGAEHEWAERRAIVLPHLGRSVEWLKDERRRNGTSLGLVRPREATRFTIEPSDDEWKQEIEDMLRQPNMFAPDLAAAPLEKIPFKFSYEFTCDDERCGGHKMMTVDWEVSESFRKWRRSYGDGWEEKFRARYEHDMIQKCDLHFYVGTMFKYPDTWIIIGNFYPPHARPSSGQLSLLGTSS